MMNSRILLFKINGTGNMNREYYFIVSFMYMYKHMIPTSIFLSSVRLPLQLAGRKITVLILSWIF